MRRDGDAALRRQVEAAMLEGKARLCDLVRLELWNGVGGERERHWLQALEDTIETVATDSGSGARPGGSPKRVAGWA